MISKNYEFKNKYNVFEQPTNEKEVEIKFRYDKIKGSAWLDEISLW